MSSFAGVLFIGGLASCSTMQVTSQTSPGADLAHYKTYAWAPPGPNEKPKDVLLDQQIRSSLESSLNSSGLVPAAPGAQPDFLLSYVVSSEQKQETVPTDYYSGYWVGYSTMIRTYRQGSLIVTFLDARSNVPFWRGIAEAEITSQKNALQAIPEATQKIVAEYRDDQKRPAQKS